MCGYKDDNYGGEAGALHLLTLMRLPLAAINLAEYSKCSRAAYCGTMTVRQRTLRRIRLCRCAALIASLLGHTSDCSCIPTVLQPNAWISAMRGCFCCPSEMSRNSNMTTILRNVAKTFLPGVNQPILEFVRPHHLLGPNNDFVPVNACGTLPCALMETN